MFVLSLPHFPLSLQSSTSLMHGTKEFPFWIQSATRPILGIRYGAAPTGPLRFREPRLPSHTPGVQLANERPSTCLQAGGGSAPTTPFRNGFSTVPNIDLTRKFETRSVDSSVPGGSEDCLFLNVYVPGDFGEKKNLPVVFYIHGGGYIAGSAFATGNDMIREAGSGVVAVVIQYRLGLFGFLPGEKIKEGGALNAGLLDQQAALLWVQKHISKFGGDPTKVTIWGESAGAGSVLQHVVANGGNTWPSIFRAAITSSTFLPSQYHYNDCIPETLYSEVVNQTNCSSAQDTLECLRAVDVNSLQNANVNISKSGFSGTYVFVPVVDGSFIVERPSEILKAGRVNGEILLSVTNTFEGDAFVHQIADTVQMADYISQLFPNFGPQEINATIAQYAGLGTNIFQVSAIMGESIFICPTYFMLRAFKGRAFKGEFTVPPGGHGQDVGFYFPGLLTPLNITTFGKSFAESFLNFVMTLDTNLKWDSSDITPPWRLWAGATEMLFNVTEGDAPDIRSVTTSSALLKRCEFWESVSALSAQ